MNYRRFDKARASGDHVEALRLAWVHVRNCQVTALTEPAGKYLCLCVAVLLDAAGSRELTHQWSAFVYSDDAGRALSVRLPYMRLFFETLNSETRLSRKDALGLIPQQEKGRKRQPLTEDELSQLLDLACEFRLLNRHGSDTSTELYELSSSPLVPFPFSKEKFEALLAERRGKDQPTGPENVRKASHPKAVSGSGNTAVPSRAGCLGILCLTIGVLFVIGVSYLLG